MYLGDFGKVIFLTKNREDAKTKKQKAQAEKKIKEFTTEYGNRFKKDGKLKREFESKYLPEGLFGAKSVLMAGKRLIDLPKFKDLRKALREIEIDLINIPKNKRGKGMGKKIKNLKKDPIMKNRGGTFKGVY